MNPTFHKVEVLSRSNYYFFDDITIAFINKFGGKPLQLFEKYVNEVCDNKDLASSEDFIVHFAVRIQRALDKNNSFETNENLN